MVSESEHSGHSNFQAVEKEAEDFASSVMAPMVTPVRAHPGKGSCLRCRGALAHV